jgi:hypothetical protein
MRTGGRAPSGCYTIAMHGLIACLFAVASLAGGEVLADLDLTTGTAPSGSNLIASGVTWTADGLFLPAAIIARIPRAYPLQGVDFPAPRAPYRADLALPGLMSGRSVTVSMVVCLAAGGGDQDNLFSIGRRSRWLSAQVGKDGRVIAGLDNRWRLLAAAGTSPVADRHWHAVSVALGEDRSVRIAVDGEVVDLRSGVDTAQTPPRTFDGDEPILSFADPGSARHLHGLVRRVIVQRGQLDGDALLALHRRLNVAALPDPQAAVYLQALRAGPAPPPEAAEPALPSKPSDF